MKLMERTVKVLDILRTLAIEHVAIQTAPLETAPVKAEEKKANKQLSRDEENKK